MMDDKSVIDSTSQWILSVVIKHNFCPFAARVADSIHFAICRDKKPTGTIKSLKKSIAYLEVNKETETGFLIMPETFLNFSQYLNFLKRAEEFLAKSGLASQYQLASFHPEYCFSGLTPDDAANYTNRSPFPMLHILRVKSLSKAINSFGDTTRITDRNIQYSREQGAPFMKNLLEQCR